MSKVLVTGVAGFIGSHIAERCINDGHTVIGIDNMSAGKYENIPNGVDLIERDICDIDQYGDILKRVDVVFHNAASKKTVCDKSPTRDAEVNGIGTLKLMQQCYKHDVCKVVHASTGSVYGESEGILQEGSPCRPVSYYGVSKLMGENYVNLFHVLFGMDTTVLRYFHVWGTRQESELGKGGVIAIFDKLIFEGKSIFIHGDGSQHRVFTHVDDVVDANMQAWRSVSSKGETYNCCSDKQFSVMYAASALMDKYGKKVDICYRPPLIGDIYNFRVDNSKIKADLGIDFTPFDEAIKCKVKKNMTTSKAGEFLNNIKMR